MFIGEKNYRTENRVQDVSNYTLKVLWNLTNWGLERPGQDLDPGPDDPDKALSTPPSPV